MGRTRTKAEIAHQDKVASLGCYSCNKLGIDNDYVLIHHVNGRSKPNAHLQVIPLCSAHHDYHHKGSLHHNLARWEAIYGKQEDILTEIEGMLGES